MTTPRIFRQAFSSTIPLTPEESKHVFTVLRRKSGDAIEIVFEHDHSLYKGVLNQEANSAHVLAALVHSKNDKFNISIAIPLLKSGGVEEVIDSVTQLGVSEIHIFEAEHSVVKFAGKIGQKSERFKTCARSAAAQCKRLSQPIVAVHATLRDLLAAQHDKKIITCLLDSSKTMSEKDDIKGKEKFLIITGPEGDFSADELALLAPHKEASISLGNNVLRAALAPVVAYVQVLSHLQAMSVT